MAHSVIQQDSSALGGIQDGANQRAPGISTRTLKFDYTKPKVTIVTNWKYDPQGNPALENLMRELLRKQ